ncbi:MAG TPA: C25 family cysteine peptidase, partial [Candidatus Limnocylindria bacterium]|nr:C25 family cysteine peptidase [Candidatus Limnocylindria bacterium]
DFFQQRTVDTSFVGLQDGANLLTVSVPFVMDPNPSNEARRVDRSALAWADLFYQRRFEPVDNELTFDSPGNGSTIYSLEPFTLDPADPGPPRVFDVTNSLAPIEVVDAAYEAIGAGTYRLRFKRIEGGPRRYRVLPSDIPEVVDSEIANAPLSSRFNLRSATQYADFLVIYYDGFRAAVDSLLRQRHERLPLTGRSAPFDTAAVPVSALYDQFSGGRTDPGAIRAFLRAAFFNWSRPGAARGSGAPAFVTMLGDASYDFKNIGGHAPAGQPASLLPTYEGGYDYSLRRQYATDDWIMNVTDDTADQRRGIPDFFEGRIPAGDASSALGYVRDKLLAFERRAPLGEWRNRIMLIADDNEQGARPDGLRWTHLCQTSRLDTINTPDHMDRVYVYLHTYPDGPGDTKPGARADMIDGINEGLSLFNYIGHGSAFKVADEGIFLESDVPSLTNLSRPSLFVAASCDIGKFHDPQFAGIGEKLVMHGTGGCVGVISATEEAFSGQNVALNKIVYDRIFARDPSDGQYHTSNAEALLSAKITTTPPGQSSTNNSKYKLLGDSGTQLNLPRRWVELSLEDENGTPVQEARRGQTLTFKGQVLDRPGGSSVPFTGVARLLIEDSAPIQSVSPADGECSIVDRDLQTYPFRAADVFRGDAGIENGRFEGRFIVPLEAKAGPMGKLRGYIEGTAGGETFLSDGVGSMAYTVSPGSPAAGDNEGPTVKLSFPGGSTSVRPDATLNVELFDPSGILITGHNLQNAIIVTLDDDPNTRIDITSSFRYAANSYQSGTASFVLPGLAPGPHNIKVSAADNLASGITAGQHRTSATIAFEVTDNPPLSVQRAFLFPNPMVSGRGTGQFVVDAPGDAVNVLIRIYTISGRLIRTLKAFGGLGQVQVAWDGLDDAGSRLAIGTYLFRVHVNPRDADGTSSSRQKAHADGRFVVVGH